MSLMRKSMIATCMALVILGVLAVPSATAAAGNSKFMVIAPHTPEDCLKVLDEVKGKSPTLLSDFEWGCMAGDHTGYAIITAKDEGAVKAMLPPSMQEAKIVKLNKFTAAQIKAFHEKK